MPKLKRGRGTSLSSQSRNRKRKNLNKRTAYMHRNAHKTDLKKSISPRTSTSENFPNEAPDDDTFDCPTDERDINFPTVRTNCLTEIYKNVNYLYIL